MPEICPPVEIRPLPLIAPLRRRRPRTPETYVPEAAALLALVRRRPGISLREICAAFWRGLAWASGTADSASGRVREWQVPLGAGACGNRVERATAAEWLRDRLEELVQAGALRHTARRRDEVDLLAALAYRTEGTARMSAPSAAGR